MYCFSQAISASLWLKFNQSLRKRMTFLEYSAVKFSTWISGLVLKFFLSCEGTSLSGEKKQENVGWHNKKVNTGCALFRKGIHCNKQKDSCN